MLAYGSKGVPLLYVIRTIPASTFPVVPAGGVAPPWEELAIGAAPLLGLNYDEVPKGLKFTTTQLNGRGLC